MKNKNTTKISLILTAFFLILLVISPQPGIFGVYAADDEEGLEDQYDDLEKIQKKIDKTQNILNLKQKERQVINAQIANLAKESSKVEGDIKENEEEIKDLEQDINRIKNEVKQKENLIMLQKKILEKFIRDKYQNFSPEKKYLTQLNIAQSAHANHEDNLGFATTRVGEFVARIHKEQEELKKDQEKLQKKSQRVEDAKYELEQRNIQLESTQSYKRVLAAEVAQEEDKYKKKLSKLQKEQLEIEQEISKLSSNYTGSFSMKDLPDPDDFELDLPVKKPYVKTQSYGKTSFSHNYSTGAHNGNDYVAQGSKSIIAAADGKVKATGNMGNYGYGKWVVVDHDNGLLTLYGHLSSVSVDRGDKVDEGDKLGKMGNTGFSTGPHIHFTVFVESTFKVVESSSVSGVYIPSGATVNPDMYL